VSESDHFLALARWTPLAIVTDLDGTLVPFAPTPDAAVPPADVVALLGALADAPGVTLAVVSGRSRGELDAHFSACPTVLLVAEHGGWRRDAGAWKHAIEADAAEVEELAAALRALAARYPGALVERKTWSVAFHYRRVAESARDEVVVEAEHRIAAWLAAHPAFDELTGVDVFEVRPAKMNKGGAVPWTRDHAGAGARVLALGDDVTDEDAFRRLTVDDEAVLVGVEPGRATTARWQLDGPAEALALLAWIERVRRGDLGPLAAPPRLIRRQPVSPSGEDVSPYKLLVVSNRLPELRTASETAESRKKNVGGLVSALEPAMKARHGVWLGWSGRTLPEVDAKNFGLDDTADPKLAWFDLPELWHRRYYNGLCNSALWPLLHSFVGRVRLSEDDWEAYRQANDTFAEAAGRLVGPDATVWIHDYHLFLLGQCMRQRGHRGPIGLFLHVPFPSPDVWFILPWAEELLTALLSLDLVGFHTAQSVANFIQCAAALSPTLVGDDAVELRGHRTRVRAFPIGILPEGFQEPASEPAEDEARNLMRAIAPARLILGVDRLDYTKGIPERLEGFARMLQLFPEWRRKVSLVQISVPSRGDVPEYARQREHVERIVGRTNGELGDADWVPIRYLYRSFGRRQLAQLYRSAAIGYVTPLRDGMNLVAKEYVAAQDPADPGVLVLSRFAGAAAELADGAVLTNPWSADVLARDLDRALRIDVEERRARHAKLLARVQRSTALTWAEDFLSALAATAG
jgi:alpha,alpha-trehalose-phosphate synthase [UDP-forming]/trehalose-phosphatase